MHFCFNNIGLLSFLSLLFHSYHFFTLLCLSLTLLVLWLSSCFEPDLSVRGEMEGEREVVERGKGQANGRIDLQRTEDSRHKPLLSSLPFFLRPSTFSLSLFPPSFLLWYGSKNRKQWNTKNRERETDRENSIWREVGMERYKQRNTLHKHMGNWKEWGRKRNSSNKVVNKITLKQVFISCCHMMKLNDMRGRQRNEERLWGVCRMFLD